MSQGHSTSTSGPSSSSVPTILSKKETAAFSAVIPYTEGGTRDTLIDIQSDRYRDLFAMYAAAQNLRDIAFTSPKGLGSKAVNMVCETLNSLADRTHKSQKGWPTATGTGTSLQLTDDQRKAIDTVAFKLITPDYFTKLHGRQQAYLQSLKSGIIVPKPGKTTALSFEELDRQADLSKYPGRDMDAEVQMVKEVVNTLWRQQNPHLSDGPNSNLPSAGAGPDKPTPTTSSTVIPISQSDFNQFLIEHGEDPKSVGL